MCSISGSSIDQRQPLPAAAELQPPVSSPSADFVVITLQPTADEAAAEAASSGPEAQQQQQQQQPLPADISAADEAASTASDQQSCSVRECRICLSSDNPEDLIQPCSCSGTVQYAHLDCLKAWVAERCSLDCELCGKQYRDGIKQQLEPHIDPRKARRNRRRVAVTGAAGGADETVLSVEGAGDQDEPRQQISWMRFWIHLGILIMLLIAVLYLALFVNVGASDNFWLMFLWRAITIILPLFLIIKCVAALYTWRQQYMAANRAGWR